MKQKPDPEEARRSCIRYYDSAYQDYFDKYRDELSAKPYDREFLTRFLELIEKKSRVLDVGCSSTAQQARFFRDSGFQVTAIDLSKKCIATAKKNFKRIEFLQMDMCGMTFPSGSFAAVNAFYSIIHIPDQKIEGLFHDFNRVLKPAGKLAIAVHAGDFYGFFDENGTAVFYRTYSQELLKKLIDKSGFRLIEIHQRQPLYSFEFQSERIYLIAEKIRKIETMF